MKNKTFPKSAPSSWKHIVPAGVVLLLALTNAAYGAVIFADNTLGGNCSGNYSIAARTCSGTDGDAYTTIQAAADATAPGDTVNIRGGDYYDVTSNCGGGGYCYIAYIDISGTDGNPITYQNYNNEHVSLIGFGFEDQDLNGDGDADGPFLVDGTSVERENVVVISADYVHVKGLEISNATHTGLSIRGAHNRVENNIVRDTWFNAITVGYNATEAKIVEHNVIVGNELRNVRYGSGVILGRSSAGTFDSYLNYVRDNIIENNFSHDNGYLSDGTKILPFGNDNYGGDHSDGVGVAKICVNAATAQVPNWCPNNTLRDNVVYHNADDGFDVSFADSVFQRNISFDNGPVGRRGYKVLNATTSLSFFGNVAMTNDEIGFELRVADGSAFTVYHNAALRNSTNGMNVYYSGTDANPSHINNNLLFLNGGADLNAANCPDCTDNWVGSADGDPQLTDAQFTVNTTLPTGTIAERRDFIRNQFIAALTPQVGSPLIDAGRLIDGYHCPTAGEYAGDTCREWYGSAPDLGAYEHVPSALTAYLTASPASITEGESSTLTWSSTNATTCTGTGFATGGATSGSVSVSPIVNTTYTVDCDGATNSATVTVTPAVPGNSHRLQVGITGKGGGTVSSSAQGISCPDDCEQSFGTGATVMLSAIPDDRSTFKQWQGDCAGTEPVCTLTMDEAKNATAVFYYFPWPMFMPAITVNGQR